MKSEFYAKIADLLALHPAYEPEAYEFVSDAVNYTVGKLPKHRHVSARELLEGIREYAKLKYGVVAFEVLKQWGLRSSFHVGEVVYLLIGAGILSASPEDSPEDFHIDFPWEEPATQRHPKQGKLPFID